MSCDLLEPINMYSNTVNVYSPLGCVRIVTYFCTWCS